ncbi:hypothetical protein ACFLQ0_02500 [Nitrospinota bacterium]
MIELLERLIAFLLEMEMTASHFFGHFPYGHLSGEGKVFVFEGFGEMMPVGS